MSNAPQYYSPSGEPSSFRPIGAVEEGEAVARPSRIEEEVSSVDSNEVDSMLRSLMSDGESTTLEAGEDEDPPDIILEEDGEDVLADLYMPPNEVGSAASVQSNSDWIEICMENRFLTKGSIYFAFPDGYELVLPAAGSRITNCPSTHIAIYVHMLDFGFRFPLDPFIVKVFQAWSICVS